MSTESTQGTQTHVLFADMATGRKVWESVGGAFVTGAVAGVLLGFAWWAYLLAVLVAFIGGVPSGSQHRTLGGALARCFVGGATWAVGVIVGLAATTRTPTIPMPDPIVYFLPYGFVPACVIGAISWYLASRRRSGEATR